METYISPSIIMRVKDFAESDLLVTFFTTDRGKIKGLAKGARRSRKRFVNCLDLFSLTNLEYSTGRKGDLYFINSGRLIEGYPGLRNNFSALSKASYMIELTELLFPWELPDQRMFEILKRSFYMLSGNEKIDLIPVIFEIMAMSQGGYSINLEKCCICGREYTGRGTAVFKPEKGAIACMNCQKITALTPVMSPDTVNMTRLMQSKSDWIFEKLNASREFIMEIRPVLKLHREYRLGCSPKTACYVE